MLNYMQLASRRSIRQIIGASGDGPGRSVALPVVKPPSSQLLSFASDHTLHLVQPPAPCTHTKICLHHHHHARSATFQIRAAALLYTYCPPLVEDVSPSLRGRFPAAHTSTHTATSNRSTTLARRQSGSCLPCFSLRRTSSPAMPTVISEHLHPSLTLTPSSRAVPHSPVATPPRRTPL